MKASEVVKGDRVHGREVLDIAEFHPGEDSVDFSFSVDGSGWVNYPGDWVFRDDEVERPEPERVSVSAEAIEGLRDEFENSEYIIPEPFIQAVLDSVEPIPEAKWNGRTGRQMVDQIFCMETLLGEHGIALPPLLESVEPIPPQPATRERYEDGEWRPVPKGERRWSLEEHAAALRRHTGEVAGAVTRMVMEQAADALDRAAEWVED